MEKVIELIPSLGFPSVCVIGLSYFIASIANKWMAAAAQREEKLYKEIEANRAINQKAIETIASYAEKLNYIQYDVEEIKRDVIEIKSKY